MARFLFIFFWWSKRDIAETMFLLAVLKKTQRIEPEIDALSQFVFYVIY